jgi:hypothetical protein
MMKDKKKGKILHLSFRKSCPDSSRMIENQTTQKKGLSIIAFLSYRYKKQIRINIINKIDDLHYGFVPTKNLHCTFLGIDSQYIFKENINDYFNSLIKENIEKFFQLQARKNSPITLKFNEFRPGTWHGVEDSQIPFASDGTVVAMGNPDENGNNEFVNLANELVCYLKNNLGYIFKNEFERKFPTVWSTLGYFQHKDFDITHRFADTFEQFRHYYSSNPLKIIIDSVRLVEYSFKDLRDARILETYEL